LFEQGSASPWGVRIDDNGNGMNINDLEDTVLWLGRSISSTEEVKNLLDSGQMRELIGRFGIGLMSCFGVSSKMTISSAKKGAAPFQVEIGSIFDQIVPTQSKDDAIGTTIILSFHKGLEIVPKEIIDKYFWNVDYAKIKVGEDICSYEDLPTRSQAFERYSEFESAEKNYLLVPDPEEGNEFFFEKDLEFGKLFLWHFVEDVIAKEQVGEISVLSEGVFVCEQKAGELLPKPLEFLNGALDIWAGKLDLAASRENIVKNDKYEQISSIVSSTIEEIVGDLVRLSNTDRGDPFRYLLSNVYDRLDESEKSRFHNSVGDYEVPIFGKDPVPLKSCLERKTIYVYQPVGWHAKDAFKFNGEDYYNRRKDTQEISKYFLATQNEWVVEPRLFKERTVDEQMDDAFIVGYLRSNNMQVIDISKDFNAKSRIVSLPIAAKVRKIFGSGIKFVDFGDLMQETSLFAEDVLYLNMRSETVKELLSYLEREEDKASDVSRQLVKAFVLLHSMKINSVEDHLLRAIRATTQPGGQEDISFLE